MLSGGIHYTHHINKREKEKENKGRRMNMELVKQYLNCAIYPVGFVRHLSLRIMSLRIKT